MPLLHKKPFQPKQFVNALNASLNNDVFYLKLTNEIFETYEDYFDRMILLNSLVWGCSLTGKTGLTFQEAKDSEVAAAKTLDTITKGLRKAIFHLVTMTRRGKVLDVCDDIFSYTREHYFRGEIVKAVIGNMWCHSTVLRVIEPTTSDIEEYKRDQIEKGEIEHNDYLRDDSWGPPPDLFKYEVSEVDPDNPDVEDVYVVDSVDVKRDKAALTRDKCRYLVKLNTYYDDAAGYWKLKEEVAKYYELSKVKFEHIFVGEPPNFEETISKPQVKKTMSNHNSSTSLNSTIKKRKSENSTDGKNKNKKLKIDKKGNEVKKRKSKGGETTSVQLSPSELKQIEVAKKLEEREKVKANRKLVAEFKKMWFKPKEDLLVEDLKDLPEPEPINCKIPDQLFGDFMMILEYAHCYSNIIKIRDYFPSGLTFETLEKILFSNEIAGPFSELLQLLLKTIFRLQCEEEYDKIIEPDQYNEYNLDMEIESNLTSITNQNNNVYNWSKIHQNTPMNRLSIDHLTLNEILRLHLLSTGACTSSEDCKWRYQQRGNYAPADDPGFELIQSTNILGILSQGSVFDLSTGDRIKLLTCLINQILTYTSIRETMDENLENFKKARNALRSLVAAEKRAEFEDITWKQRIRSERAIPDLSTPKPKPAADSTDSPAAPNKNGLTDEQIEKEILKRDRETEKRKNSYHNNHSELLNNANKYEKKLGVHPIGRDRGHRRYWIFSTLPGLFVENSDECVGECTGPTPIISNVDVNDINFVRMHFDKLKADEENLNNKENSAKISKFKVTPQQPLPLQICNGNSKTCRIHSKVNLAAPKWSFYSGEQQLNELIENLTVRGVREKELKSYLSEEKEGVVHLLSKCPKYKLNFKYPSEPNIAGERKSNRIKNALDPNLNFPTGTSINKICELQIRDIILETEDKIFLGGLGSLKVSDRVEWRSNIENRKYEPLVDNLYWGSSRSLSTSDLPPPPTLRSTDSNCRVIVREMACAVLQLEQSIESKFFKRPLGIDKDEPEKKKSQKKTSLELNENLNRPSGPTQLEKWETSLMKCVTFSQLFLHLFTLDNSIQWTRSVLNARCRICRRKGDGENMLLCDRCNKGHHLYCLKPELEVIPKGDWFCVDCRPVEELKPRNQVKKKYYKDDEESSEEEQEEEEEPEDLDSTTNVVEVCEVCKCGGEVICCDGCPSVYHLYCLNPPKTRVPRGEWLCEQCASRKKKRINRAAPKKKTSRQISNSSSNSTTATPTETSDEEEEEEVMSTEESEDEEEERGNNKSVSRRSEQNENSEDEEEEPKERPFVKVKFNSKSRSASAAAARRVDSEESSGSSRNDHSSRHGLSNGKRQRGSNELYSQLKQKKLKLSTTSSDGEDQQPSTPSSTQSSEDEDEGYGKKRSSMDSNAVRRNTRLQRNFSTKIHQTNELDNVVLDRLLQDIIKHRDAWPFLKPVTKTDAPDYHNIITNPMDLGTVKYKLNSMVYTCNTEFIGDLRLIFDNCFLYNPPDNQIYKSAEDLQRYCEKRCTQAGITF